MANVKYTKIYIDKIRKLYISGLSQKEIAKEFNTSQSVICKLMKLNNIKPRKYGEHCIKHGLSCKNKKYYCQACGKQISDYRKAHCSDCKQLGKLNHNYKGGSTKHCCKVCGKRISYNTFKYGSNLCRQCSIKGKNLNYQKENHPNWKGGFPNCIGCGKKLSGRKYKRCQKCSAKITVIKGKKSNLYGKTPISYKITWKNNKFKSFWEYRFAVWCTLSHIKWKYEPRAFDIKYGKGFKSYTPDFYLPEFDLWIEIKGWWRHDALIKFKKFKRQHKDVNIEVFNKKELKMLGIPC